MEVAEIGVLMGVKSPKTCFNEAAIWRSRKCCGARGVDLRPEGFNEAAIWRSRKYSPAAQPPCQPNRFNEAAIWRSRKSAGRIK